MPIYEYTCTACGHDFENLQKVNDPTPPCPDCGKDEARKRVSRTTFQLKGSGWYVTDYKSAPGSKGAPATPSSSNETSSESKPAETKAPETKSEPPKSGPKESSSSTAAASAA